jgi:membrane protease YdiL (CAAX protease family)
VAEVVLCSGYVTQLVVIVTLNLVGIRPAADGTLTPLFIFSLTAADTVLLLGLVLLFMRQSGDRPRDVFLGDKPVPAEIRLGMLLLPAILVAVMTVQVVLRLVAPSLHNVDVSPFAPMLASPLLLAGFIVLVLIGGGVREELQRAFLLRRFEQRLGGDFRSSSEALAQI